jgi:uncharacterized membrane-anchored protein
MSSESTPELGARYWAILCLASVAGCNLGDFISLYLHLGHWVGLFSVAAVFAVLLGLEKHFGSARLDLRTNQNRVARASEAWYWTLVVLVRTAATNAADLATHTFQLDYSWVIAALEALQVMAVLGASTRPADAEHARYPKPVVNGWYWASLMIAGTLGTAVGDCVADQFHLGTGWGTLALSIPVAAILMLGFATRWAAKVTYWFAVIAIRSAGTTAGDWLADSSLGLLASTCVSCATFAAVILLWRAVPRHSFKPLSADS